MAIFSIDFVRDEESKKIDVVFGTDGTNHDHAEVCMIIEQISNPETFMAVIQEQLVKRLTKKDLDDAKRERLEDILESLSKANFLKGQKRPVIMPSEVF